VTILVTGGAGFIGSHIVDAYVNEGNNVIVIDDLSSGVRENVNPKAEFHKLDVRSPEIEEIFQRHAIDVVNQLRWMSDARSPIPSLMRA
jgi:UDP-glucose 4-epimerase